MFHIISILSALSAVLSQPLQSKPLTALDGCPLNIDIIDKYGDNWNGAKLTVTTGPLDVNPQDYTPPPRFGSKIKQFVLSPGETSTISIVSKGPELPKEYWEILWSFNVNDRLYVGDYYTKITATCMWQSSTDYVIEVTKAIALVEPSCSTCFYPPPPTLSPTTKPTRVPTDSPTTTPTSSPSSIPTELPTSSPTTIPTSLPSSLPTTIPSSLPTVHPTSLPTSRPTKVPTAEPTSFPTKPKPPPPPPPPPLPLGAKPEPGHPTSLPSDPPTFKPTYLPSSIPTSFPTSNPTTLPTVKPTPLPTSIPTSFPTPKPTTRPSSKPTSSPTSVPSSKPTSPTSRPTVMPTNQPTVNPTSLPTSIPTVVPTATPTDVPTADPTSQPTKPPPPPKVQPEAPKIIVPAPPPGPPHPYQIFLNNMEGSDPFYRNGQVVYYSISDLSRTKLVTRGTVCGRHYAEICTEQLSDGDYVFRMGGNGVVDPDQWWKFCGITGVLQVELVFALKNGKCYPGAISNMTYPSSSSSSSQSSTSTQLITGTTENMYDHPVDQNLADTSTLMHSETQSHVTGSGSASFFSNWINVTAVSMATVVGSILLVALMVFSVRKYQSRQQVVVEKAVQQQVVYAELKENGLMSPYELEMTSSRHRLISSITL